MLNFFDSIGSAIGCKRELYTSEHGDIHGVYYNPSNRTVLHLQGCPGFSDMRRAVISGRCIDENEFETAREKAKGANNGDFHLTIGNEYKYSNPTKIRDLGQLIIKYDSIESLLSVITQPTGTPQKPNDRRAA